jgi:hypothetical protein
MFRRRHSELGAYAAHEFCIEMSAQHALIDAHRRRIDPLNADTWSTFTHEYFHYLQNVSTVTGFAGYHAHQQLLAHFSATIERNGESAGSAKLAPGEQTRLRNLLAYIQLLEGDGHLPLALESVKEVEVDKREFALGEGIAKLSAVHLLCDVETGTGQKREEGFQFGLYAMEEGLAFEIDRIVAGMDGAKVDEEAAPGFPYLVLRFLGKHLAPRIERRDLIVCGVLALLTNDPGAALIDGLKDFHSRRSNGQSAETALRAVDRALRPARHGCINQILTDLQGLKRMYSDRGTSELAMSRLVDIFEVLLKRRIQDPVWDIRPFLAPAIDHAAFSSLLSTTLPCLIIQKLPDDPTNPTDADKPQHDVMIAFGNSAVETTTANRRALPVLQCHIHYVRAHIGNGEFLPSSKIVGDDATCPFYRSCTLQLRVDHGQLCKEAPWRIYAVSEENTCWYGAAVAGTLGTVRLAPDPPGPERSAEE